MISNLHYHHLQAMPENTGCVDIHDSLAFSFSMESTETHYWNRIQYQTSGGSWSEWDGATTINSWQGSDGRYHIKLRGIGNTCLTAKHVGSYIKSNAFSCSSHESGDLRISGNIENLLDYSTVARGSHCTLEEYGLERAFSNWSYLRYVDPWFLPLPSIPKYGCQNMFSNCSNLVIGPEIPATTIEEGGCAYMFSACWCLKKAMTFCNATSLGRFAFRYMHDPVLGSHRCDLEVAPAILPATTLTEQCYAGMYKGCDKLKHCPRLLATALAIYCCSQMFQNCASLTVLPELPVTTLAGWCYQQMFSGCTSIKLSQSQTGEYQTQYRIPKSGAGTTASNALLNMFTSTGGTFTGTPEINTTYYTSNPTQ